ncbi:UDP-N-acetylglucosamine 1-carboxyvinyltransferase, partial [bacterium]|nr:UDP-N-acetylglucosamine 1-carboxyvinyltransferase [bacterium]
MPKYIISGPTKLSGEISVMGAKNSALKIIPAALLSGDNMVIKNTPYIKDIDKALSLLEDLGVKTEKNRRTIKINPKTINKTDLNAKIANKFRASIMFVGPLLARFKEVSFPHPGGCVIGAGGRPIDLFLDGFKHFGAEIIKNENNYKLKATKLKACDYFFTVVSVTATEALMMTAVLANGVTTLRNSAMEPEIKALADYLNSQGAKIKGAGTSTIKIEGVKKIKAGTFKIIPDRIETGSFAIMAAATRSKIRITRCKPDHIRALLEIFKKINIPFREGVDWLEINKPKKLRSYNIKTHEFPGFPTDLQSPFTVLMTQAEGSSLIHETIYDRRLLYVDMLSQMGADITMCDPHRVVVNGPTRLYGKNLTS